MSGRTAELDTRERRRWEELPETRPGLSELLSLVKSGALGFMGGCVRFPGRCAPVGIALTASGGCGGEGLCCMLGAAAGYALKGGLAEAVRYEAALLLTFTAAFVLHDTPATEKKWFMPATAAVVTGITGALSFFEEYSPFQSALRVLTEMLLAARGTILFAAAGARVRCESEREEREREKGRAVLLCCGVAALSGAELGHGVVPGRCAALLLTQLCAFARGGFEGIAGAAALGLSAELGAGSFGGWGGCVLLAALAGESIGERRRKFFAAVFSAAFLGTAFWCCRERYALCALELTVSTAVFLLLPDRVLRAAEGRLFAASSGSGWKSYAVERTRQLSDAFEELYEVLRQNAEENGNDENAANVYDRAAESVCRDCVKKEECWHLDYIDTLTMLNDATLTMRRLGRLDAEDLPERFRERCLSPEKFLTAVNGEWRAMNYRRRLRARLAENRTAAFGQYRYLSAVLRQVAEELRCGGETDPFVSEQLKRCLTSMNCPGEAEAFRDASGRLRIVLSGRATEATAKEKDALSKLSAAIGVRLCRSSEAADRERTVLLEAEPLRSTVGIAAVQKEGERVSGDRGTFFKTEQGVLCVLLSDGMGSGESAERESLNTVRILEKFLRAGVEPATAMQILNSVMLLKNGEEWGYATVDLMCVDLFTGAVDFYKYGAAPSYIRSGRTVRRIKGLSLAAGILLGEGELPDVMHMELQEGGFALVASDGVISPESDGWLREKLLSYEGKDPQELAGDILREAAAQGSEDDMTVLCVYLEARA